MTNSRFLKLYVPWSNRKRLQSPCGNKLCLTLYIKMAMSCNRLLYNDGRKDNFLLLLLLLIIISLMKNFMS